MSISGSIPLTQGNTSLLCATGSLDFLCLGVRREPRRALPEDAEDLRMETTGPATASHVPASAAACLCLCLSGITLSLWDKKAPRHEDIHVEIATH